MKILIISPYFAPFTGVGALRMTSLTRYLLRQGEHVIVVKIMDSYISPNFLSSIEVKGASIYEYELLPNDRNASRTSFFRCLEKVYISEKPNCCIASFGPFDNISIITRLTKKYEIPLIVDYRDLLFYNGSEKNASISPVIKFKKWLRYYLAEQCLLKQCDAFVTVTPRTLQTMVEHYPVLRGKGHCIFNGYTSIEAISQPSQKRPHNQIQIFVLGKLISYTLEGAKFFFLAVSRLIQKGYPIIIVHAGMEQNIYEVMRSVGFPSNHYLGLGQLSYEQALMAAKDADICSVIINSEEGLGTKVFDYIYLDRPIVAYAPKNSELEEVLLPAENAFICQETEQMEAAIRIIIDERRDCLTVSSEFKKNFSREIQNKHYYQILQEVIKNYKK